MNVPTAVQKLSITWSFWKCMVWLFWAIAFGVWETWAGLDKKHDIPMLTQAVVKYVPWYVTMFLLTWAMWHFGIRYASASYKAGL